MPKVGADPEDDLRRGMLIRSIIDNPDNIREDRKNIDKASLEGKSAGPTGCVLMVDANREVFFFFFFWNFRFRDQANRLTEGLDFCGYFRGLGRTSSYRVHAETQANEAMVSVLYPKPVRFSSNFTDGKFRSFTGSSRSQLLQMMLLDMLQSERLLNLMASE